MANARLRKVLAAVLAVPVLASVYCAPLARRSSFLRPALVAAVGGLLTIGSYGGAPARLEPSPTHALVTASVVTPRLTSAKGTPARPPTAAASASLGNQGVLRPVRVDFSAAMDRTAVEAALTIVPAARVHLTWTTDATSLQVAPATAWRPGTRYLLTIGTGARDSAGTALRRALRATFVTRPRPTAAMAISRSAGNTPLLGTALDLRFSRPVRVGSVAAALRVTPAALGRLSVGAGGSAAFASRLTWRPTALLRPGTRYTFTLSASVRDAEGLTLASGRSVATRTPPRPAVVRHRPGEGTRDVDPNALLSVRFSEPMARRATERAFTVSGVNAVRGGAFRWADRDTVLVFDPARPLEPGRLYQVSLDGSATSVRGVPLGPTAGKAAFAYRFWTATRRQEIARDANGPQARLAVTAVGPAPPQAVAPPAMPSAGAPWLAVEQYVLRLINCVRTGGRLQSDGSCVGYGSGRYSAYVRPLSLHPGISARVARPYAKYLAIRSACNHFLDGDPGDRLRRAGYTSYRWGENLGCRSGDPYRAVLGSHLYFQSEQPYNGGHWRNIKNAKYTTVGIGVWVSNGNVRVITDFYDP
ncbi:MAG: Ig-like domain-containing protein [Chloroflexota bacterium]|nr:Ig-like domain-containing protein [Chloroflexota bacterium]